MPAATLLAVPARYPQTPAIYAWELEKRMDLLGFIKSMALLAFVAAGGLTIALFVLIALMVVASGGLVVWLSQQRS